MQIKEQSRKSNKVTSFFKSMRDGVNNFFTPNRKRAIKNGATQLFEATETILGHAAHPRKTYRSLPRIGKLAVATGIAVGAHFGLLHINKQEQKNKAKDIVRNEILTVDGSLLEDKVVLENARIAQRNFKAFVPTLTERQADSLEAQNHLAQFVAYSILYKKSMDIGLYYNQVMEEKPREFTPDEVTAIHDSINAVTEKGRAYGGAALVELDKFSNITKTYIAPEFSLDENGIPQINLGTHSALGASAYEAYQQTIELFSQTIEEISHLVRKNRDKQPQQPLKRELK